MKKLFSKIMGINAKKNIIYSIIICVIFCIVASIGVGVKFGSRIVSAKEQISVLHEENKSNKETSDNNKHNKEKDENDKENKFSKEEKSSKEDIEIESIMNFGIDDYIFMGVTAVIGLIVLANYWITAAIYAVQKSEKVGANKVFFGVLTLITNIIGILILHIYLSRKHTCSKCGKIQNEFSDYCYYCGEKIKLQCPSCQAVISANDKYCTKCGTKIK